MRMSKSSISLQHSALLLGAIFAAYLGNAIRYDVEVGQGVVLKADIREPWHHELRAIGSPATVSFDPASTVAVEPQ